MRVKLIKHHKHHIEAKGKAMPNAVANSDECELFLMSEKKKERKRKSTKKERENAALEANKVNRKECHKTTNIRVQQISLKRANCLRNSRS